jgi:Serpin (serine protease inhibitor)
MSPFFVKLLLTVLLEASGPGTQMQKELALTNPNMNPNLPFVYRDFYSRSLTSFRVSSAHFCDGSELTLHYSQNKSEHYDFDFGTRIFVNNTIEPRQRFVAICDSYYDVKISSVNFAKPDEAAGTINEWCAQATRDNIKSIVKGGGIGYS